MALKYIESKSKSFFYTIFLYVFVLFEMGVLSGFRFCEFSDKYKNGLTFSKVDSLTKVGENVGWNFIVCSILIILAMWGLSMLLGYNRNPGGLISLVLMNVLPVIGVFSGFNFFIGYGYSHYTPAMAIFGLTNCATRAQQITNNLLFAGIITVLCVICWFIGYRIRAAYAAKYEFDF